MDTPQQQQQQQQPPDENKRFAIFYIHTYILFVSVVAAASADSQTYFANKKVQTLVSIEYLQEKCFKFSYVC